MPAHTTRDTLARQWELLKCLPSQGSGISAREAADRLDGTGFAVSKRQVERDLNELSRVFPLYCNDKSTPYGWRWADNTSADLPGVTLADALSLRLIEDTLRPLLPRQVLAALEGRFHQARKKLAGLGGMNSLADWPSKVRVVPSTLPLLPPDSQPGILASLQDALLLDRVINADYLRRGAKTPKTLELNPLGLVQSGPVTYLVAVATGYEAARLFALHRFSRAEVLDVASSLPANLDLDGLLEAGLMQFGRLETVRMEARISPALHQVLMETPLSPDQVLTAQAEERPTISATVPDSELLRRWILSQGPNIEVIAPVELRLDISKALATALASYSA